ncbi:hypothetical protein [Burkholderia pseudomallei]|uniref:hypothetical protein n=1 Tax=Burkholderia pseudomallei TaxID=28450 RepID=UPI00142F975B|nr:hypothetical protein [Burkholderia pseudomallei]
MTNRSRPMHRQAAYRTRQSRTPRHGFAQTARRPTGDRPTRAFPIAQVMRDRSSRFAACQISARERFARPNARASRASPFDAEALAIRESARPRAHGARTMTKRGRTHTPRRRMKTNERRPSTPLRPNRLRPSAPASRRNRACRAAAPVPRETRATAAVRHRCDAMPRACAFVFESGPVN